jgi:serine/threonine-protein kinase
VLGRLLFQRYRILKPLGQGGMGSVYQAEDVESGRSVAVKVLSTQLVDRDSFVRRFRREADLAATIRSSHVAAILDRGVDDESGLPFIVMERFVGEDLAAVLQRTRELPVDVALRVVSQACAGLEVAHGASIVHRDIKPGNLFLARDDADGVTVKVLDFGIAKPSTDLRASHLTQTGAVLGSPLYMSPEQARGSHDVDHRADIWSLGVVLYEALCGRTPHRFDDGIGSLIVTICTERPRPVQDFAPWVPPHVARILRRALTLQREARFPNAAALRGAILDALGSADDALTPEMFVPLATAERRVIAERLTDDDGYVGTVEVVRKAPARTDPPPASPPRRILVVEDNEMNMDMLSRRLERRGYSVIPAVDGETGVALALSEQPDLVLMDLGLPGIDGFEATRQLRAAAATRKTPVVAITAHATPEDRTRAIAVGCDEYEAKPIELPRLLEKIEALLARTRR